MYRIIGYNEPTDKAGFVVYDPRINRNITNGKLSLKENEVNDLTLTVNQANPLFDAVKPMHTHIEVYDDGQLIFRGRAIKPTNSMETSGMFLREYVFEDIEAYLLDSTQRFYEGVGQSPKDFLQHLIDVHNGEVDDYQKFEVRNVDVESSDVSENLQIDYPQTLDAINEKLVSQHGGYIVTEYNPDGPNYIDYLKDVGEDHENDTPIQLAKNMKSASMTIDPTQVITRLIPLGKTLEPSSVTIGGGAGTGGASLENAYEFAKSPITASWGCDINAMKNDFAARSQRVRAWGVNVDTLYNVVRDNGVSPEWFFAYELCEQGTGWGWLNHTYRHGDAYQDAAYVCDWIKSCANSATINPAWWAPEGSIPANPALAAQWSNDFGPGSIGRVYLQGTAAATWELAGATPNPYIGKPLSQCIGFISSWGGHTVQGGAAGGSWGWPFPSVGEGNFMGGQLFGVQPGGGFRPNGFHDGLDFGAYDHPGSEIHAVHGGTVTIKSWMGGLNYYVVTHSSDGFNIVYQEAFSSSANIFVNVGDVVNTGDVIGVRTTDHLHVGVTKADFMEAVRKSYTNDGTWLDPQKLIREGGDGSLPATSDTVLNTDASNGPRPKLTIASVNEGKDYIDIDDLIKEFGIQEGKVEFSDIEDAQQLLDAAKAWIEAQRIPQSWSVTALELHMANFKSFKVSDRYLFNNPYVANTQMLRIVSKEIDLLKPEESTLTIGDKQMGIDDYQAQMESNFSQIQRTVVNTIQQSSTESSGSDHVSGGTITANDISELKQQILNLQNDAKRDRDSYVPLAEYRALADRVKALEDTKSNEGGDESGN